MGLNWAFKSLKLTKKNAIKRSCSKDCFWFHLLTLPDPEKTLATWQKLSKLKEVSTKSKEVGHLKKINIVFEETFFDIDANGILNVSASDKSTDKVNKITITINNSRVMEGLNCYECPGRGSCWVWELVSRFFPNAKFCFDETIGDRVTNAGLDNSG